MELDNDAGATAASTRHITAEFAAFALEGSVGPDLAGGTRDQLAEAIAPPARPPEQDMRFLPPIIAALSLTACGSAGSLKPPEGQPLPVKPAMAQVTPTAEDLLSPPTFAAPERIDELMRRSMPRKADRFDLPPAGGGAAPIPETETDTPADEAVRVQEPR